ncbi:MAG: type 4a pilus biogenesis protein PilO [Anaerohalosphaera sp.]|nr:type 4a pilus biogenesis protein PilO [Anaerohalosphaera sp.]
MSSTIRKIIFLVVLLGLTFVAYAYMIKPANQELTTQRNKVTQDLAKLIELEKATADAESIAKQMEEMKNAIDFFESKLPPKSEIHTVLEDITVIAKNQGLTSKSIRTLKQKTYEGYIEKPLKMELSGDFSSYYSFLLELEKMDRIAKIQELSLKKKSKHEGQTEAVFVVSVFFQDSQS